MQNAVTELRRDSEAVKKAARYAEDQLKAVLELKMSEDEATNLFFKKLLVLITSIGYGQDESALMKAFDEMLACIGTTAPSTPSARTPTKALADIETELKRRASRRHEMASAQEELLNERDGKQGRLDIVADMITHDVGDPELNQKERDELTRGLSALRKTIDFLTKALSDNDRKVSHLISYRTAVEIVAQGLPQGVIGEDLQIR